MAYIQNVSGGMISGNKSIDAVENGKTTETSQSKADETKNMFLNLLVTEMKYQNPLEPTDNTEYVKEMATFSQVEALNNVQDNVDDMRSATMVGKYVNLIDDDGNSIDGKVDFTTKQNGQTVVSVNGNFYPMTQVTGVMESGYYEATLAADTLNQMIADLPPVGQITYLDEDKITAIGNLFNSMDGYQQSFLGEETINSIKAYVNRLNEVLARKAEADAEREAESSASTQSADQVTEASGSSEAENTEADTTAENTETTADAAEGV